MQASGLLCYHAGQEHLKWDVQLILTMQKLQEELQQQRLTLDELKGRRHPALPCTPNQNVHVVSPCLAPQMHACTTVLTLLGPH